MSRAGLLAACAARRPICGLAENAHFGGSTGRFPVASCEWQHGFASPSLLRKHDPGSGPLLCELELRRPLSGREAWRLGRSPRCSRILRTTRPSVRNAIRSRSPPQCGQVKTSIEKDHLSYCTSRSGSALGAEGCARAGSPAVG